MTYNEKLISLRKKYGYTQEQLAEKIGVSRQAISRWEAGETMPDTACLIKLCDVFQVSADQLIRDEYGIDTEPASDRSSGSCTAEDTAKKRSYHLISAICFAVGALCAAAGIAASINSSRLGLSVFVCALCSANAAAQFILWRRRPDSSDVKETQGRVLSVTSQLWLKVNTKAFRGSAIDGAQFPHVVKAEYTVNSLRYVKSKWYRAGEAVPAVGSTVTVLYSESDPTRAELR